MTWYRDVTYFFFPAHAFTSVTCFAMAAQGVKTYIYWSTKQCRDIVRKVLEPHPHTGLHQRTIFDEIHRQFPDLKNDTTIIPKRAMTDATNSVVGVPPHPEHPLRSRRYVYPYSQTAVY